MRMQPVRNRLISVLDIGTTKVSCFVARVEQERNRGGLRPRIIGVGSHAARGVRAGSIVNMAEAESSIRAAVDMAERMAGATVHRVTVNISCGQPESHMARAEVTLSGPEVREFDVKKVLRQARQRNRDPEGHVIHAIPVGYALDGNKGIADPRGMFGTRLGACLHFVTALAGPMRNLAMCIERCHLEIVGCVASPYAAGLSCLVEDETDLGVTCVDMGGGQTGIALFAAGNLIHVDHVPVGGMRVTNDVAYGLSTSYATAERVKALYGSATVSPSDEREMIDIPCIGEEERDSANHVPRSILNGIIQYRLEETFEMVRDRIAASGMREIAGRKVVLTGGASQLSGVRELASEILGCQVRVGRPIRLDGFPEAAEGPGSATAAGLISFAMNGPVENGDLVETESAQLPAGRLGRVGQWLRQNL